LHEGKIDHHDPEEGRDDQKQSAQDVSAQS
jgi:hypothetical protein